MIPKIIHYCWFGGKELPQLAKKCIESWKIYLPDYEIKEWNEENFDINQNEYVKEAYEAKKFAFVTDFVRLFALYNEGGIYMDTDVEVLRNLDVFLNLNAFSGFEDETMIPTGIMGSEKKGNWVKENLDYYYDRHFLTEDGTFDLTTNVVTITNLMLKHGLYQNNTYQDFVNFFTIYPKDYFCPKSYIDGKIYLTENTYCIHHFASSWLSPKDRIINKIARKIGSRERRILGKIRRWLFSWK
ncbi:glycosyltransferase family 32 protein [Bacteroides sp. 51]|uniref:glycosyltransferase family 32 protein n=1 Tax=Bacteroides sp. 51 TaxID=2302938 RepID=UPI0013D719F0|nr:glycosyltransferase [Bacteroides sp. 51]NDV84917.1 glycosyl transferase [Bacteroides sp. 51]